MESYHPSNHALAATITRTASKQTYYTIRFLVDRDLVDDAYRAYAYFRWLDDWLDQQPRPRAERLAFVKRQQAIIDDCGQPDLAVDLVPEEYLLIDLLQRDKGQKSSGLHAYIRNMMAVMAFDADRRGRFVSQRELHDYTRWLAVAVTEALHYFIGHHCAAPQGEIRYMAVSGAHITHMLRDTLEDAQAGYYNIPSEVLAATGVSPWDVKSDAYRDWVRERVRQARACFRAGREYLAQVENLRCRIAGFAYIHRFEAVLDTIERSDYVLQTQYRQHKGAHHALKMIGWALWMTLTYRPMNRGASTHKGHVKV